MADILSQEDIDSLLDVVPCAWNRDSDVDDVYYTSCKNAFVFTESGSPKEHNFLYCPYCGLDLLVIEKDTK